MEAAARTGAGSVYVASRVPSHLFDDVRARAEAEDRTLSSAIRIALRDWTRQDAARGSVDESD